MAQGRKTLDRATLQKERERVDAAFKAGSINKAEHDRRVKGIEATLSLMDDMPTREVGSTMDSLREYAEKLSPANRAEVERIAETLNAGVKQLRDLFKDVVVTPAKGEHKGKDCKVLPRWFINTPPKSAKGDETPAAPAPALSAPRPNRAARRAARKAQQGNPAPTGEGNPAETPAPAPEGSAAPTPSV